MKLEKIRSIPTEHSSLTKAVFTPDGKYIASGHKHFKLYVVDTGAEVAQFEYGDFISELKFSPSSKYAACVNVMDDHPMIKGKVSVFDGTNGKERFTQLVDRPVETCAFSHDERHLVWKSFEEAEGPDGRYFKPCIDGINLNTLKKIQPIDVEDVSVRNINFFANDIYLACFGPEVIGERTERENGAHRMHRHFRLLLLNFSRGIVLKSLDLGAGVGASAVSPDGKLLGVLAMGFEKEDRNITLFDIETGLGAKLIDLEPDALPYFDFGLMSKLFFCAKEDENSERHLLRAWETEGLRLFGQAKVDGKYHSMSIKYEQNLIAFTGESGVDIYYIEA